MPCTLAGMVEVDGALEPVQQWLRHSLDRSGGERDLTGLVEGTLRGRLENEGCRLELLLDQEHLCFSLAPRGSPVAGVERLGAREPSEGFRGSRLLRALEEVPGGAPSAEAVELLLNLTPLWSRWLAVGSEESLRWYRALELARLPGVLCRLSPRGDLVEEGWTLCTPDGADLLSRLCGAALDPGLLPWIPETSASAGLLQWEPRALGELARALIEGGEESAQAVPSGITWLARAPLEALGPRLAFVTDGSGEGAGLSSLAVEVVDEEAWAEGLRSTPPPLPGFVSELRADRWLVARDEAALRRVHVAAEAGGRLAPAALREASRSLAEGSRALFHARLPSGLVGESGPGAAAVLWSLKEGEGAFELGSRSRRGALLPLLRAAIEWDREHATSAPPEDGSATRERRVLATLRDLVEVQRRVRDLRVTDADGDGVGEFLSLAELAGARSLRGRAARLSPPLLDPVWGELVEGCARREGYLFRLCLSDSKGRLHPEALEGGSPRAADPDGTEAGWVVYAWPESGQGRAFVVDQTGEVFASDNEALRGPYGGLVSTPAPHAAYGEEDLRRRSERSVRRGRDGAIWVRQSR